MRCAFQLIVLLLADEKPNLDEDLTKIDSPVNPYPYPHGRRVFLEEKVRMSLSFKLSFEFELEHLNQSLLLAIYFL